MLNYKFTDIIDVTLVKKVQELFSRNTGMTCGIADSEGRFVTKKTMPCGFCEKCIRKNKLGAERCEESNRIGAMQALIDEDTNVYRCHAGLTVVVAPIMFAGKYIGSVMGGCFLLDEMQDDEILKLASELGISEDKLYDASKDINIVKEDMIDFIAHEVETVAYLLSEIAAINFRNMDANIMYEKNVQAHMTFLSNLNQEFKMDREFYAQTIKEVMDSDDIEHIREALLEMYQAVETKSTSVDDTVEYAKMSSGQLAVNEYEYSPEQMIDIMCGTYSRYFEDKKVEFECEFGGNMPAQLLGDAGRISQIMNKILQYTMSVTQTGKISIFADCVKKNYALSLVIKVKSECTTIGKDEIQKIVNYSDNNLLGMYGTGSNNITVINQIIKSLSGEFYINDYNESGILFEIRLPQLKTD